MAEAAAEMRASRVTRAGMLRDGIPHNSPIYFVTDQYRDSLPASMAEDDRPMTWNGFQRFMREVRASWEADEAYDASSASHGLPDRPLSARQVAFARGLAAGHNALEAYKQAGFAPHRGNAHRLTRDPRVVEYLANLQG